MRNKQIVYSVHQDGTNVWWVANFYWMSNARPCEIRRSATQGGTLNRKWQAEEEGEDRAEFLRSRGFDVKRVEWWKLPMHRTA